MSETAGGEREVRIYLSPEALAAAPKSPKPPPRFSVTKVFETFLGVLSGAAIALISAHLSQGLKTATENQLWFENRFVFEGLAEVQGYAATLSIVIANHRDNRDLIDVQGDFPKTALSRLIALFGDRSHAEALAFVRSQVTLHPAQRAVTDAELAALAGQVAASAGRLKTYFLAQDIDEKTKAFALVGHAAVRDELVAVQAGLDGLRAK